MPTPANRSKLLPARGSYAALEASLPDLLDGEMVFATDQRAYYQVEAGALVAVNARATTTTEDVETVEGSTRSSLRDVIPPEIPAGWTDLVNQREVNWWLHREVENVANRTTINEQQLRDQAERIYDLENVEAPGGIDLDGYATTTYVDGQDKAISDQLHQEVENVANRTTVVEQQQRDQAERIYDLENIEPPVIPEVDLSGYATTVYVNDADKVISDRLQIVEQDYTTTAELNAANSRISGNSKEIEGLQGGFDVALLAAQEGSENLTIELQSYAKKEDAATKDELTFVDEATREQLNTEVEDRAKGDEVLAGAISDLREGLEGHTHDGYASSSHAHNGYASSSHAHTGTYVKGNYTISKNNGNYYIS